MIQPSWFVPTSKCGILSLGPIQRQLAQTAPERACCQAFRISSQRPHQPTRALFLIAGFAGCIRMPQESRRSTPTPIRALQTIFVNFSAAFELGNLPMILGHSFARFMQAIAGKGSRYVLALV